MQKNINMIFQCLIPISAELRPPLNTVLFDEWIKLLVSYPRNIPLRDLLGTIHDQLLERGICPGGSSFHAKSYLEGRGRGALRRPWFDCYDWLPGLPAPLAHATPFQGAQIAAMRTMLANAVMYALFPHMARTLEGLGLGWVSYWPHENPSPTLVHATEVVIRQLGVRWLPPLRH